jgi:hypothetical protein
VLERLARHRQIENDADQHEIDRNEADDDAYRNEDELQDCFPPSLPRSLLGC